MQVFTNYSHWKRCHTASTRSEPLWAGILDAKPQIWTFWTEFDWGWNLRSGVCLEMMEVSQEELNSGEHHNPRVEISKEISLVPENSWLHLRKPQL